MNASTRVAALAALVASACTAEGAVIDLDLLSPDALRLQPGLGSSPYAETGSTGTVGPGPIFEDGASLVALGSTGDAEATIDGGIQGMTDRSSPGTLAENAFVVPALRPLAGAMPRNSMLPLTAAQTAALLQGRAYINLHARSTGTSRPSTIVAIPEPTGLVWAGLALLGLRRRRARDATRA